MTELKEELQTVYQRGKIALERGRYQLSIEELEKAKQLSNPQSKLGGEVRIWLVSAYQAANQIESAIALCQDLIKHPSPDIRKKSERILYILKAPALKRPEKWLTKIPDLSQLPEAETDKNVSRPAGQVKPRKRKKIEPKPIDPSEINRKDNNFIWITLLGILILLFFFN